MRTPLEPFGNVVGTVGDGQVATVRRPGEVMDAARQAFEGPGHDLLRGIEEVDQEGAALELIAGAREEGQPRGGQQLAVRTVGHGVGGARAAPPGRRPQRIHGTAGGRIPQSHRAIDRRRGQFLAARRQRQGMDGAQMRLRFDAQDRLQRHVRVGIEHGAQNRFAGFCRAGGAAGQFDFHRHRRVGHRRRCRGSRFAKVREGQARASAQPEQHSHAHDPPHHHPVS
jgi:hypothetical protein